MFGDIHAFIQIIAGLNFAFATSNGFNTILYDKVVSSIEKVNSEFAQFAHKIKIAKQTVRQLPDFDNGVVETQNTHKKLISSLNTYEEKNKNSIKKLENLISDKSRTNFFMLICFYTGLYCVLILLYDAFEFFSHEQLFTFNILSLILFLVLFSLELDDNVKLNDKSEILLKNKKLTVKSFLVIFLIIGVISFLGISCLNYNGYKCPVEISTWLKISTVLLSGIHFIWYLFLSAHNSLLISEEFSKSIKEEENNFDEFFKKSIEPAIIFANHINKLKKEDN